MKRYNLFLACVLLGRILTFVPWVLLGILMVFAEAVPVLIALAWDVFKDCCHFLARYIWEPIELLKLANDPNYKHRAHLLHVASPPWREMPWRCLKHSCGWAI